LCPLCPDTLIFQKRRPELENGHARRERRFRHREPVRDMGSVEGNLEGEPLAKQPADSVRFAGDFLCHSCRFSSIEDRAVVRECVPAFLKDAGLSS
jgi:hypothetical protein